MTSKVALLFLFAMIAGKQFALPSLAMFIYEWRNAVSGLLALFQRHLTNNNEAVPSFGASHCIFPCFGTSRLTGTLRFSFGI